ncbi:PD40 domain-containing protein [Candidatus Calescamantes bacterium]|nr:PD40 domain-containing protein [Candidatus Calescamantes bacterium]
MRWTILLILLATFVLYGEKNKKPPLPSPEPVIVDNIPKTSFAFSPDGEKIAISYWKDGGVHIYVKTLNSGEMKKITNIQGDHPSWSPRGDRLVFNSFDPETLSSRIFLVTAGGHGLKDTGREGESPVWSPLGDLIALTYQHNIWTMNIDGSDFRFLTMEGFNVHPSWSPDGKKIVFSSDGSIAIVNVRTGNITEVLKEKAWAGYPVFSPSGDKIAFVSTRTGQYDIWIINLSDKSLKQITCDLYREFNLEWRPEGYIYYLREEEGVSNIWRVKVE